MNRGRKKTRREVLRLALATAASVPAAAVAQAAPARIIVIGGGFAGAMCARALKRADPRLAVTLIEASRTFTACPLSSAVIAGARDIAAQQFSHEALAREGIALATGSVTAIDGGAKTVALADGARLVYDRLVLAPGIDLRWDHPKGYNEAAADQIPHAWTSDANQILLLRKQLEAMEDGGLVAMSVPLNPIRCPPGPYERASLIAHYLKTRKPRSKLLVLDAKDQFSMQRLFQSAWKQLYPGHIEWIGLAGGGNISEVDVAGRTLVADFEKYKVAVANVIPPQRAGRVAALAGAADRTGWCPIDPVTFESKLVPGIHVIGDAAIAGALPKSAVAASAEGKLAAAAIIKALNGEPPTFPRITSICYSLVAPDYAISISGVYAPEGGQYLESQTATSPLDAPPGLRAQEAAAANDWFATTTREIFG